MRLLACSPAGARRDLLRVLESDSRVRADVIRQFHERADDGMVEVLTDVEADELIRGRLILLLHGWKTGQADQLAIRLQRPTEP